MRVLLKVLIISLISWLATTHSSYACDCSYAGKFSDFSKGQTVIKGKINSYGDKLNHGETLYTSMRVSVSEVIKGSYPHNSIIFRGDPGHLCLTYVDSKQYTIGSEHLFILLSKDKNQGLAGCGEVSVYISKEKVHGTEIIRNKSINYSMSYDHFIENIQD